MRYDEIFQKIKREEIDGLLFTSFSNVFYLSRFNSSNAYILMTNNEKFFFTDSRYFENARKQLKNFNVVLIKKGLDSIKEVIDSLNLKKIGFEKDKVTISFYERLKEKLNIDLKGYEGFLNEFRIKKTEEEINIIKNAVRKTDNIYKKLLKDIPNYIGKTELSVRQKIIEYIFQEDGTGESFPAIVASGQHSSIPHWETSNKKVKNNILLIDMGMKYKGYCSDFTRTIHISKPNKKFIEIYNIVKEAHLEAVSKVKAGIPLKDIDIAARAVIEKYGYGEYFTHSTGHGIGIDIHEEPRIYKDNETFLEENTVFTIEPGIYIPNFGGVRLENVVVAKKNKAEILTKTPLDLVIL